MENIIALVPMKEHSERVPEKNFRLFNGKPLFYWILRELMKVDVISGIFVDTDSKRLADLISSDFSDAIEIIDRPPELCGDAVSMNAIIEHDMSIIDSEHFLQTHSTNPLLSSSSIENSIDSYFSGLPVNDSLFSVTKIQNRCYTNDGAGINHNPEELIQTQYLKPVYIENSNIYIFSKDSFAKNKRRIGEKPILFEMNQYESVDIDEEEDFKAAEALYKGLYK
ncbi:MAG: acylneuraminate cytidylyltransferase family protein [Oscillospiraceae bacterium]|nr:acylneuraminate cytidylyltransferase family protein [Oscillospiraceae bacterium]